ncbi:hypothetical protein [Antrihabitans spumae]|uniref:DUF4175 domain-containing protein n=1 Tax=Antrihabitans spumae TaxID=3373370 RepID=A0ABW7KVV2_9NOCA
MGIRIDVRAGPLRWSRPLRIPRAQINALNLIGALLYLATLAGLWVGLALAVLYEWRYAVALFLAIGAVLSAGLWVLGRRAWAQWGPVPRRTPAKRQRTHRIRATVP